MFVAFSVGLGLKAYVLITRLKAVLNSIMLQDNTLGRSAGTYSAGLEITTNDQ